MSVVSSAATDAPDMGRKALRGMSLVTRAFLVNAAVLVAAVLALAVAEGNPSREIAEMLVLSEKTVERHRANILAKLGMSDRVELTRYAIRRGLAEP
jgi:DNA-binding CsgD family transcriptional regulator